MAGVTDWRGISAMLGATAAFVVNDTFCKMVMDDLPPLQTLFLRGVSGTLWCVLAVVWLREVGRIKGALNRWTLLRAASELVAVIAFFLALSMLPIADITAITQVTPLIVMVLAAFLFSERIGPMRIALILIGFAGAMMVAGPGPEGLSAAALLGFVTALGAAGRDILARRVPADVPGIVAAVPMLVIVMIGAGAVHAGFEVWRAPDLRHALLLLGAGFFLMLGQLLILYAYRHSAAGTVAPFFYSFTLWAVVSGLLVFGETPGPLALVGMGLIVLSGVALARSGSRRPTPAEAA
jgi:drug/metabolite transporter (DMT)-like permease